MRLGPNAKIAEKRAARLLAVCAVLTARAGDQSRASPSPPRAHSARFPLPQPGNAPPGARAAARAPLRPPAGGGPPLVGGGPLPPAGLRVA